MKPMRPRGKYLQYAVLLAVGCAHSTNAPNSAVPEVADDAHTHADTSSQEAQSAVPNGELRFAIQVQGPLHELDSVNLTVGTLGIQLSDEAGSWEILQADQRLQTAEAPVAFSKGNSTIALWQGTVDLGTYARTFIYLDEAYALHDNARIELARPDGKLHGALSFEVAADAGTTVTYQLGLERSADGQWTLIPMSKAPEVD